MASDLHPRPPRSEKPLSVGALLLGVIAFAGIVLVSLGALFVLSGNQASPARVPRSASPAPALDPARAREIERLARAETPAQLRRAASLRREVRETHREAVRWFSRSRLGLFFHYGPTSLLAAPTNNAWWRGVRRRDFQQVVRRFRPDSATAVPTWIRLAKETGASYLTVVVKHHDGYDLWPSRLTTWSVSHDRDLLATLAPAARRAHLRLFLYYSLLDLHEPTYRRDMAAYLVFVRAQLRELLTSYGPVAGIWFDGTWDLAISDAQLEGLYAFIHRLQPWTLVATNHHRAPLPGEDFQIFEAGFPGRPAPAWAAAPVSKLPHQAAITLGPTWFWNGKDAPLSSVRFERLLAEARATHTSLLANVSPRPDGSIGGDVLAALQGG